MKDKEQREDIGTDEQDLGHHTQEGERVAEATDEVEGFSIHEPSEDELDADDGYVHEPPEVDAVDIRPAGEED